MELKVVAHVHSDFSHNGSDSIEQIAQEAERHGVDAIVMTDTAIADWRYGLLPSSSLLSIHRSGSSILDKGPQSYLDTIERVQKAHPNLLIVPGAEASAYYRWAGRPWETLTAHDWNRHLLLVGMTRASDYQRMPVLGNPGGYSICWESFWPLSLLLLAYCGRKARIALLPALLSVAGILFLVDSFPFRCVPNAYAAATPWEPYQDLVNYAHRAGALVFIAHPEATNWKEPVSINSRVRVQTEPYPEAVQELSADGFGIYMEGLLKTPVPGGPWDAALKDYCSGHRERPAWAIAELDYKGKGRGPEIDEVFMEVTTKAKTQTDLLDALRSGNFYSVYPLRSKPLRISWKLAGAELEVEASRADGQPVGATLTVVRDGGIFKTEKKTLPARWTMMLPLESADCGYVRIMLEDAFGGQAASNPIFLGRRMAGR